MVYVDVWPHGWRSEERGRKWLQSGECDLCEHSWSRVSLFSLSFFFFSILVMLIPLYSHMVPLDQPEAAVVCLLGFSALSPLFLLSCLVSHFLSLSMSMSMFMSMSMSILSIVPTGVVPLISAPLEHILFPRHRYLWTLLMCFFFVSQDLITRWIMDIPLLLDPTQES